MSVVAQARPVRAMRVWLSPVFAPKMRPYAALAFCVDGALIFVLFVAIQTYLPGQRHVNAALPGYVLASFGAAKLAGQLAAGWLSDRFAHKRALTAGLALALVSQAAMLLSVVWTGAVLGAAALYGLSSAVVWPSLFAIAAREFPDAERARFSSGMTVATGAAVASALGLAMVLPSSFPFEAAVILGLCASTCAVWISRGLPDNTAPMQQEATGSVAWPTLRAVVAPQRLAFSLIVLLQAAMLGGVLAVFRSYGTNILHTSFREELLLLAPAGVAGAFAVLAGGALGDRFGRIPVLGGAYILLTFAVWGLSTTGAPSAVVPLSVLAAIGLALALPCTGALSLDLSKSTGTGTLLGWFLTMEGAGHAIGPAMSGLLNEKAGTATVFWLIGGLAAVISLIALVPPIWGKTRDFAVRRSPVRSLAAGTSKLALVFGLAFPGVAAYFAWDASSQLYGDMVTHGPRDRMEVAITFDDGPNAPWTTRIADALDRYGVDGTFFIIGQNADAHPEIVRDLVARGNLVGNHSYHHSKQDAILDLNYSDLWKAEGAIASAAGVCPAFYRPPNGFHTPWQLHAVANHDMTTVTWDVIPRDWKDPPPDVIVNRVLDSVKPGSIILLHDGDNTNQGTDRSATLSALPGIIEGLRNRNYSIVRLDQLLGKPGYLQSCDLQSEAG